MLEYLKRFIHPRGPLERRAPLGVAGAGEAVGVDPRLDLAIGALERSCV
jgi:hypothetical protein